MKNNSEDREFKAILHLHSSRSSSWKYGPVKKFGVPDCYVPFFDRIKEYASSGINAVFFTDHDVPFVMREKDHRKVSGYLERKKSSLKIGSGEEVTLYVPPRPDMPQGEGLDVLIIYRGLHPYYDRKAILDKHRQIHRYTNDILKFFRFIKVRDDLIDIVAHPFAGPLRLNAETFYRLLSEGLFTRFEVFCGGEATLRQNWFAYQVARNYGLGMTASDDKHQKFGALRNYTYSYAKNLDEFLDHLNDCKTHVTTIHKPVFLRKYYEVIEGFYRGYLPWAIKNFTRHMKEDALNVVLQRAAFSMAGVPLAGMFVPLAVAHYLTSGEKEGIKTFARLAELDPRLETGLPQNRVRGDLDWEGQDREARRWEEEQAEIKLGSGKRLR